VDPGRWLLTSGFRSHYFCMRDGQKYEKDQLAISISKAICEIANSN